MHNEIEKKIVNFVEFLPKIYEIPLGLFENELHSRLNDIVTASDNYPQQRESFRQMLIELTEQEL